MPGLHAHTTPQSSMASKKEVTSVCNGEDGDMSTHVCVHECVPMTDNIDGPIVLMASDFLGLSGKPPPPTLLPSLLTNNYALPTIAPKYPSSSTTFTELLLTIHLKQFTYHRAQWSTLSPNNGTHIVANNNKAPVHHIHGKQYILSGGFQGTYPSILNCLLIKCQHSYLLQSSMLVATAISNRSASATSMVALYMSIFSYTRATSAQGSDTLKWVEGRMAISTGQIDYKELWLCFIQFDRLHFSHSGRLPALFGLPFISCVRMFSDNWPYQRHSPSSTS